MMRSDLSSHSPTSDWFRAIRKPPPYRIGSSRFSIRPYFAAMVGAIVVVSLIIICLMVPDEPGHGPRRFTQTELSRYLSQPLYNDTYPLTMPARVPDGLRFRIAVVTDLDEASKQNPTKDKWTSFLSLGHLTLSVDHRVASVTFDPEPFRLESTLAQKGRGMELSELVVFNGKLYSCDDRTGMIYHVSLVGVPRAFPWVFLADGPGDEAKGFKCEWMSVKDDLLYVGGLGKEWTSSDGLTLVNHHPMFVKTVSRFGDVLHEDWSKRYVDMRAKAGIHYPGYMIHESAVWSSERQRWLFLPRRAHHERYDDKTDEHHATNLAISADADFSDIRVGTLGVYDPTRGYSSFKHVPGTGDKLVVALRSREVQGSLSSFISVWNAVTGDVVMDETPLPGNYKFEGIEFI